MNAATVVLVVLVFLLVLRQRQEGVVPTPGYPPGVLPFGTAALTNPSTGATGTPSTRTQIETGVGSLVGAGAGLYLCSGNPLCASAGAYVGGVAAPFVSRGAEVVAKDVAGTAESVWGHTLGRIF